MDQPIPLVKSSADYPTFGEAHALLKFHEGRKDLMQLKAEKILVLQIKANATIFSQLQVTNRTFITGIDIQNFRFLIMYL